MTAPPLGAQTVLLTGAGTGLGRALARAFDAAGSTLVLVDVNAAALEETAALLGRDPELHVADLSDAAATLSMAEAVRLGHGAVDTLVHNAGFLVPTPYAETDRRLWDTTFNVGIQAAHLITQTFWREWLGRGAAAIYLSSRAGIEGGAGHAPYVATKHAIEGFVKVLGEEGREARVFAHSVTPGMYMHTPMSEQNYTPELKAKWVDPLRLTPGILHLAERREPALTGRRVSAWDLSEAHRDRYAHILDRLLPAPSTAL